MATAVAMLVEAWWTAITMPTLTVVRAAAGCGVTVALAHGGACLLMAGDGMGGYGSALMGALTMVR